MLNNKVLDAFVTSVANDFPFVSFHNNQVSIVPANKSSLERASFAVGTFSKIHLNFVPLK
jgi:hypothetical protein